MSFFLGDTSALGFSSQAGSHSVEQIIESAASEERDFFPAGALSVWGTGSGKSWTHIQSHGWGTSVNSLSVFI